MMNICEIPEGLSEMLRDFTVAVLRHCPENLYEFAADYFAKVLDARTSNAIPMYIVVQDDDDAGEPDPVAFKPKTARQNRLGRRHSVSAERYDPEADEEEEEAEAAEATGAGAGEEEAACKRTVVYAKNDSQRQRLKESVAGILIFRSLEPDQVNDVIDAMFERRVVPEEHVIEQDDDGDNFYVIESGTYDVIVRATDGGGGGGGVAGEWRKVHQFEDKGSFGELALMYNMPRSATVVAVTPGTLWAMDRKSFRRIVLKSAFRKRKLYERFIETVPMLQALENYERMNVADALVSAAFEDGDCVIREGAEADGMYFIEEGNAVVTITKDGKETEAARIQKGSYFGEMALVENAPRSASVYAAGRMKAAFLERKCFERLLGPCLDIMKRNISTYQKSS